MRSILKEKEAWGFTDVGEQGSHGERCRQLLSGNMQVYGGPFLLAFYGKESNRNIS